MNRPIPQKRLSGIRESNRSLTQQEVVERRELFGANRIVGNKGNRWLDLLRDTLRDPMIWFLLASSFVYLALGSRMEAYVLLASILPLVGMDSYLHRRTRASTEGLASRLATTALAIRDGAEITIPSEEIVSGDLVRIKTGEYFPADGIMIAGDAVQVDESSLTGESYPVGKEPLKIWPEQHPEFVLEPKHLCFAGTRVLTGTASVRIIFTGGETLYGEIVRLASGLKARTPLQTAISQLVRVLLFAAAILCVVLAFVRLRQGYGWADAFISATTLAVAALPEEFPVVFTIFLGVGVYRLARSHALVRRAVSVENIGRISTICVDKTGTITEGRLCLDSLFPSPGTSDEELLRIAATASRLESGDVLDRTLLDETARRELQLGTQRTLNVFPFTEDRRRETSIVQTAGGSLQAATKGAPEIILEMTHLTPSEKSSWLIKVSELSAEAKKVIACARHDLRLAQESEPTSGYQFIGLLAFADPIRKEAAHAVNVCRQAGIHVLMMTGDHPETAMAVARSIGLNGGEPRLLTNSDVESLQSTGPRNLREIDVVARVLPSQKLEIVRTLKASGEVVAFTGDGVNDVPALQEADVGIAMGERGTQSARDIASIVLLDDNFSSIVRAISEGRQLFFNLKQSFKYLLMIHIPLVITATLIPILGFPLLYLPIHIIWLEAIIHPTALLVFQELPPPGPLESRPASREIRFFTGEEWGRISAVGGLITLAILFTYIRSLIPENDASHARAMALAVLTFSSAAITAMLSRLKTKVSRVVTFSTVGASTLLLQTPLLARVLHASPLHWDDWFLVFAIATAVALLPLLPFRLNAVRGAGN